MSSLYLVLLTLAFDSVISLEPRVFAADDLRTEVHKYLVKLKICSKKGDIRVCSGSILDKGWVITSAHCFVGDERYVAVLHQGPESRKMIATVDPHNIISHPDWTTNNFSIANRAFDIALLRTSPIKFSDYVQPIKLSKSSPRSGNSAIIAGFGRTEADVEPPREGLVAIDWYPYVFPGLLCSKDLVRAGSGDSGGALVSQGKLIGVTSGSCKNVEAHKECITVYTSIYTNLKWLQEILLN